MALNQSTGISALVAAPLLAMAFTANAQTVYIEPSTVNLNNPVNGCVQSTPNQPSLTAAKKLNQILEAQGQMIAGSGNKLGVDGKGGKEETLYTTAKNLSGRGGYIISSSHPKEKHDVATGFCLSPISRSIVLNPADYGTIPAAVNKGELGIVLKNQSEKESYTAIIGRHENGSLFAVHFNKTGKGAMKISNSFGNEAVNAEIYADFKLSDEVSNLFAAKSTERAPAVAMVDVGRSLAATPR